MMLKSKRWTAGPIGYLNFQMLLRDVQIVDTCRFCENCKQ